MVVRNDVWWSYRLLKRAPLISPCGFRLADDGHVTRSGWPGDVHPLAFADGRLRIVWRDVHDPAVIWRPAIVITLGGECRNREADHQNGYKENMSHGATFP